MAAPRSALADTALRGELIEIFASSTRTDEPVPPDAPAGKSSHLEVSCVLFDVYGTLFSSASGDVGTAQSMSNDSVFAEALKRVGLSARKEGPRAAREAFFDEINRRHTEDRRRGVDYPEVEISEVWEAVLARLDDDGLLERDPRGTAPPGGAQSEALPLRLAAWYERLSNPVVPMPGAVSTIRSLALAGALLGIVSNAQFYTPLLFPALLGEEHTRLGFREELCAWSYRFGRAKPAVELFSKVLERLESNFGIEPASTLYVGNDMLNDVWTAHRAGCRTALFAGDKRSLRLRAEDPRCETLQPDLVIRALPDLLEALSLKAPRSATFHTEKGEAR